MHKFKKEPIPRNPHAEWSVEQSESYCQIDMLRGNVFALCSDGTQYYLFDRPFPRSEYIAGFWRIQDNVGFENKVEEFATIETRSHKFIVHNKRPETTNGFEYYDATMLPLQYNCYGPLSVAPDCILANLHTHWGYGKTIDDAAAYLSRRLSDVYRPAINAAIKQDKKAQK